MFEELSYEMFWEQLSFFFLILGLFVCLCIGQICEDYDDFFMKYVVSILKTGSVPKLGASFVQRNLNLCVPECVPLTFFVEDVL